MPVKQPENVSTSEIMITERFSNTSQKLLTRYHRKNKQEKAISTVTPITAVPQSIDDSVKLTMCANQQDPNRNWGSNVPHSSYSSVFKCRIVDSGEAVEAFKRRRSFLDHKIQQLSEGSSEGSGIIPEVPNEPNDNSEVVEKQARNVQTSLTLSSAKLETQSMVDVPIHQEDPTVQRTPLIETVTSMNIRVIPKYHNEDGNPSRANIKQALGRYEHVGPQDTRPQDGERSQDDNQRLDLADDLKKAQDHISSQEIRVQSFEEKRISETYVSASVKEIDYVHLGIVNQAELKLQPRAFFSFCTATYTEVKILPNLLWTWRADAEGTSASQTEQIQLE
ncbi:hypothetical protein Tco_0553073 [Tanacetum coccineum]